MPQGVFRNRIPCRTALPRPAATRSTRCFRRPATRRGRRCGLWASSSGTSLQRCSRRRSSPSGTWAWTNSIWRARSSPAPARRLLSWATCCGSRWSGMAPAWSSAPPAMACRRPGRSSTSAPTRRSRCRGDWWRFSLRARSLPSRSAWRSTTVTGSGSSRSCHPSRPRTSPRRPWRHSGPGSRPGKTRSGAGCSRPASTTAACGSASVPRSRASEAG